MPVRRAAVLVVKLILEGLRDLYGSTIFKFIESNRILCFHEKCPKVYSMIPCLYNPKLGIYLMTFLSMLNLEILGVFQMLDSKLIKTIKAHQNNPIFQRK